MDVSILIPVYNFDCRQLVSDIHMQAQQLPCTWEIIVVDDASSRRDLADANAEIGNWKGCRYLAETRNRGRAAVRNYLAQCALGNWLLFMDCDGRVRDGDFLRRYLDAADGTTDVVCGGICHADRMDDPMHRLRYLYEKRAERRCSPSHLSSHSDLPFRTFCFMIRRALFEQVKFDETFTEYGYEDVLFGMDLQAHHARIVYIDNPLENIDIETNPVFVEKTEEALRTLRRHEAKLGQHVRLLKMLDRLRLYHALWLLKGVGSILRRPLRRNLCSTHPCIRFFNLYKLLYYVSL